MKKSAVAIVAVAIGLWLLLRKPEEAEAESKLGHKTGTIGLQGTWENPTGTIGPQGVESTGTATIDDNQGILMESIGGPDPDKPTPDPTQGMYYHVQAGDTAIGIASRAGLPGRAWRAMRDHEFNEWMPMQEYGPYNGEVGLPLYRWFPRPFFEVDSHDRQEPGYGFPIVYVPTFDEAEQMGFTS